MSGRSLVVLALGVLAVSHAGSARAQLYLAIHAPPESAWPRFQCEEGTCPPGVGALLSFGVTGQVGFCTATLIGPDRIVTAAHCIPDGAPGPATAMHFFLPDEHAVTLAWAAVTGVIHREDRADGADHAVLRLHRAIDAPVREIARRAPAPETHLEAIRVSPHADRNVFVRRERCVVMPRALSATRVVPSAIARISGCAIVPGNSGAPLVDSRGRIVAVVSTGLDPPGVAVLLAPWLTGPAPFVGTLSSLACVPPDVAAGAPAAECASWSRRPDDGLVSRAEARDAAIDAQQEALADRLLEWERAGDAIGWDLERRIRGDHTWALPVPGCIDIDALVRARRIDAEGRFRMRVQVPTWEASAFLFGFDLQMVPITQRTAWVWMEVTGRFDDARESAAIRVRVRGLRRRSSRQRAHVPVCRVAP